MTSISSKNVENLFNDLDMALIDIKTVLDPFALLSLEDFHSHLNKKLKESYRRVMIQMFPNQENVHEKMMKLLNVHLSLINSRMENTKIYRLAPKVIQEPFPHKPMPVIIKDEEDDVIEIVDAVNPVHSIATSTLVSPIKDNPDEEPPLETEIGKEVSADETVAIDYENVKKATNRKSDQDTKESKKTQFKCKLCDYTSFARIGIKRHQMTHKIKSYKCNDCSKTFDDKELFSKHKKVHEMTYYCKRCKRCFHEKDEKDQHEKSCKSSGHYSCKQCDFTCNSKIGLMSHEKIHAEHYCDHCNKNFNNSWNFQQHKRVLSRRSVA